MSAPRICDFVFLRASPSSVPMRSIGSAISTTSTTWRSSASTKRPGACFGLVRLKEELDEETAEFAILVRSRLKGHGLGWLLMQRVIDYAKEKDLRRVYGDVLVENTAMLQMCAELGFREEDLGSGMKRVVIDLENGDGH